MKLDDRPVIDQLLNPTPLNVVHEVAGKMHDHVSDSFEGVQSSIDEQVFTLLELVPEGQGREDAFDLIRKVADTLCEEDERRSTELLWLFAEELEHRL